ncbi:3-oxoacyl-[acyl-carrier-protein] synthase-3 [Streptacidiphilus sp. MAP12-33]|uniref:ketoacyl-ACP synthase III family protein n=1 Tax=Streptacidiphilus sp. MAP12-33 TaxID=3156266 RepID=UPI003518D90E
MKLTRELGLAAVTAYFPTARQGAEEAMALGLVDAEDAETLGRPELPVSADLAPPEMAVAAGRQALEEAGVDPARVGLLVHSWMHHQGHDIWSAPHYVAHQLGAERAQPVGVQQQCNGGVAALETAAARLLVDPSIDHALVTTGDRFVEPGWRRWTSDYGIAFGDAATALLLHERDDETDMFTLSGIAIAAAPELEEMHRGDDPFSTDTRPDGEHADLRRRKKAYLARRGIEGFAKAGALKLRQVVTESLADAGLEPDDQRIACVALPRLGRKTITDIYAPAVAAITGAPVHDYGHTGHLGTGDAAASLAEFRQRRLVPAGQYGVVLTAGGGFTWSSIVVRTPER